MRTNTVRKKLHKAYRRHRAWGVTVIVTSKARKHIINDDSVNTSCTITIGELPFC